MATRKLSLAVIRRTVSALPGVEEGTSYGTPAWRHKGKLLARLHQDGRSIVLKVGDETRDHLLQADPKSFFVTDHYIGYPMVLAHLDKLSAADLKKLLERAMGTGTRASGPHHERAGGPPSRKTTSSRP
jgi:hypothetical protein